MHDCSVVSERDAWLARVRGEFPALNQAINGHPLTYLDSAATAFKPRPVIQAVREVWERDTANIHRGVHRLSIRATERFEEARAKLASFLGAREPSEIVFVRGATEAINLVAASFAEPRLEPDDEIVITGLEHHANIVPWQVLRDRTRAKLRVVPIEDDGSVSLGRFESCLSPRTRLVAFAQASNALGTVLPVKAMIERAHAVGAKVLVDGAQAVAHLGVDVQALGCDFYVLSGHKLYGPDGVGVLYARRALLEEMRPYQTGGDMILSVTFEQTLFNEVPYRFEAGTPNISGVVGLGAAVDFLGSLGSERVRERERVLLAAGTELLAAVPKVRLIGTAPQKIGVLSFCVDGVHPHDIGTVLDSMGICVRTGHHCAQPLMERFGVPATVRASLGIYNTIEDLERLVQGVRRAKEMFG